MSTDKKQNMITKEIEKVERDMLADKYNTALKKMQFIGELKSGLGNEIKTNGNKIRVVKKPFLMKIKDYLKKIFTKF